MNRPLIPPLSSNSVVIGDFSDKIRYLALVAWVIALGVFLAVSPDWFFGPSWRYFAHRGNPIPPGGLGMGLTLIGLGVLQVYTLWRNKFLTFAMLLNLAGFVFWTSGVILMAEGLLGHQGLIEGPLMLVIGIHKFVIAAMVKVDAKTLLAAQEEP